MSIFSRIHLPRMKYKTIAENVIIAKLLTKELRQIAAETDNIVLYMGSFFRLYSVILIKLQKFIVEVTKFLAAS